MILLWGETHQFLKILVRFLEVLQFQEAEGNIVEHLALVH